VKQLNGLIILILLKRYITKPATSFLRDCSDSQQELAKMKKPTSEKNIRNLKLLNITKFKATKSH
jgi:hypothetical protein